MINQFLNIFPIDVNKRVHSQLCIHLYLEYTQSYILLKHTALISL